MIKSVQNKSGVIRLMSVILRITYQLVHVRIMNFD